MEITITRRTRSIGFGFSTTPTGNGTEIAAPEAPKHEGTVKQVLENRQTDRTLRSLRSGGVFIRTGWFHKGQRITAIRTAGGDWTREIDMLMGWLLDGDVDELEIKVK